MPVAAAISTSTNNNLINKKKLEYFQMHLIECIKSLAYVQLIIIYLYDISFIRLLLGSAISTILVSKSNTQQLLLSRKRYILITILAYNAMCIFIHIFTGVTTARAGKYLHGSLTIEFIGVQALPSRLFLVAWSFILFILQILLFCLCLAESKDQTTGDQEPSSDILLSGQVIANNIQVLPLLIDSWSYEENNNEQNEGETIA